MEYENPDISAVILAGGKNKIPLYEGYEPGYKALLEFGGRCSVKYVIDALNQSRHARDIVVVGPEELEQKVEGDFEFVESGDDLLDNVRRGVEAATASTDDSYVLVTTADVPLITAESIDHFLEAGHESNAEVCSAFVHERHYDGEYSRIKRRFFDFRDGPYAGGNLFLFDPSLLAQKEIMERIEGIYGDRKKPLKMAMRAGMGIVLLYLVGVELLPLVTLDGFARRVSSNFGVRYTPIKSPHPEVELDVDYPKDYEFVKGILG